MSWSVVEHVDRESWSAFVAGHPDGNVFQTPEMHDVFARTRGHRPRVLAVRDGAEILALFTPVDVSLSRLPRLFSTRSIAYGGLLAVRDERGPEAAAMLLERNDRLVGPALVTEIRNVSDAAPFDPGVRGAGYEFADHLNYLVDLRQSPDRILAHMDRRVRSVIRRGETDGSVEVLQVSDPEGRAACYDLLVGTYRRIAVPLADRSLFEAIAEVLEPRGMARFLLGRVNGSPAATAVALTYHGRVYDWFAGNDRVFTRFKANELVTWSLMEWGAANGYETFDWGGAGSPHEPYGVRAFKAKWGGELVSYGRYLRVHAPTRLRVCSLAYAARRRMLLAGSRAGLA